MPSVRADRRATAVFGAIGEGSCPDVLLVAIDGVVARSCRTSYQEYLVGKKGDAPREKAEFFWRRDQDVERRSRRYPRHGHERAVAH